MIKLVLYDHTDLTHEKKGDQKGTRNKNQEHK